MRYDVERGDGKGYLILGDLIGLRGLSVWPDEVSQSMDERVGKAFFFFF